MLEKMQFIANADTRNQWDNWTNYRSTLATFIDQHIEKMNYKPKRILVMGAGNGNDIPLEYLERVSEEIVLVDIDQEAMNHCLKKVMNAEKYKTIVADLSGLMDKFRSSKIYSWPANEKIKYISGIIPKPDLGMITGKFDLVLNCNYATQLVAPYFLWGRDKSDPLLGELIPAVERLTGRIMGEIFRQVSQLLNPDGGLIHLTDFLKLKWNKRIEQASPDVDNICGSELPKFKDFFILTDTNVLSWEFIKNQEEQIILLVLAYYFSGK